MAGADESFVEQGLDIGPLHLEVPCGIGTNKWGVGKKYDFKALGETYNAALDHGVTLFNTAQLYNSGESEQALGKLRAASGGKGLIVSKFASLANGPDKLCDSLRVTLERCQVETLDAFLIHHPTGKPEILADQLALAVKEGLTRTVGVSNYGADELRQFHALMAERGVPILWNEIEFSLLRRAPETTGLLEVCAELGVTVLAWAPLASGRLTGKHTEATSNEQTLALLDAMQTIGEQRSKSLPSIAINWCICKGVVPIPGARTCLQANDNCGGVGWRLTKAEVAVLDALAVDQLGMYDDPEAIYAFLGWWPNRLLRPVVSLAIWAGTSVGKLFMPLQRDAK